MDIGWFFLWLGVALAGLGLLLLRTWWRERRFEGAALTLSAGLLLLGAAVQQFILVGMAESDGRAVDSPAFITVSIVSAAFATAVWIALATKRGRESLRRGAERPRRIRELEVLGAIGRLASQQGSVEEIGGAILEAAAPAVGADAAVLLLYDPDRRTLSAEAASGIAGGVVALVLLRGLRRLQSDDACERQAARGQGRRRRAAPEDAARPVGRRTERTRRPHPPRRQCGGDAELLRRQGAAPLRRGRTRARRADRQRGRRRPRAHQAAGRGARGARARRACARARRRRRLLRRRVGGRAALESCRRRDHRPGRGAGRRPAAGGRPPRVDGDRAAGTRSKRPHLRGQARRDAPSRPRRQGGLDLHLRRPVPGRHRLRAARPDRGARHREAEERVRRDGLARAADPTRGRLRGRNDAAPPGRRA